MARKRKQNSEDEVMEIQADTSHSPEVTPTRLVLKKSAVSRIRTPRNDLSITRKERISLKAWFINLLNLDRRMKEHHFEQVRLYMHGLGLGDTEEMSKYENALKGYFGG